MIREEFKMKKHMKIIAMVLVLALALSVTAFAAGADEAEIHTTDNAVTFVTTGDYPYEQLNISFTNAAIVNGEDYMIWVVAAKEVEGETVYVPTDGTIQYIGQAAAAASSNTFTFNGVFPTDIVDSAVMISGPGLKAIDTGDGNQDGLYTIGTIEMLYTPGDVDGDGLFSSGDALLVLQHSVKLITLTGGALKAANVDSDPNISSADALRILQRSVGLIDSFN